MPNSNILWIFRTLENDPRESKVKNELFRFWNEFYTQLEDINRSGYHEMTRKAQYKEEVLTLLENSKAGLPLGDDKLREMQQQIEDLTLLFDEKSIQSSVPNIIKLLIRKDEINAKDYLRKRELSKEDLELLYEFGQYTIEALIVHVLSMVFNTLEYNSMIRVSTLVERLESSVRTQAFLLRCRRCKKEHYNTLDDATQVSIKDIKRRSKLEKMYPFGSALVQFMDERGLITFFNNPSSSPRPVKKKGAYYLPTHLYAMCNFDISLLPIKLNLPMVCPPVDWTSAKEDGKRPKTLSDLIGGYLSGPTGEIYDRYRLLSSGDLSHFFIYIGSNYEKLCNVMNNLQRQAFKINSEYLQYLQDNYKVFVEYGFLMPQFLSSLNIKDASDLLREFYMKDEVIKELCSFSELLHTLSKNIQRSRYETFIIKLAKAYDGYHFYLPAFLDFRGRIYRSGILHFHERDLARSLIVFADSKYMDYEKRGVTFAAATAFHYKSFVSVEDSLEWLDKNADDIGYHILDYAQDAKHPFQFISYINSIYNQNVIPFVPITQDASASAYQIMSYFLLDETLAKRTNLTPSEDGKIQDIYSFLLEELKEFMQAELNKNLSEVVCGHLSRKIVKGIFMPIIYGKTLMSTACDLNEHFSHFITKKECFDVASVCFKLWRTKYQRMENLIRFIRHIGWIASARDCPVLYKVPYFTTVQDYMVMEATNIWVFDRLHKKRRRVTLRVPSSKRDRRKTEISTFVNFIHQKDAHIAMCVVEEMLELGAPIYTVHDNFITTAQYSHFIPLIYSNVICNMGPPLLIINEFIYYNVIKHILNEKQYFDFFRVIPIEELRYYLEANIPENISKKMKATWEERILGILTSYENYTRSICGDFQFSDPKYGWKVHEKKWNKFQLKVKGRGGIPKYCVHH
jgi:sulfatase maturation enzyme AslB (radical SAM superfamily)